MSRLKMCLHHVYSDKDCERCEKLVAAGKIGERVFYTQQRVWQLEQKAKGRCEICGHRKGKCESDARCIRCLCKDAKRKRKRVGSKRRWMPGMRGRPRSIPGGPKQFEKMKAAAEKRAARAAVDLAARLRVIVGGLEEVQAGNSKGE